MKSILVVASNQKEQYRLKMLLSVHYNVKASASVHTCVEFAGKQKFDLVLYDTRQIMPVEFFIDDLKELDVKIPLIVLAQELSKEAIQKMRQHNVLSAIRYPCNKGELLQGVKRGFQRIAGPEKKAGPEYVLKQQDADILICLKKHAVVTHLYKEGMVLSLPAFIPKKTKVVFRNQQLFERLKLEDDQATRVDLVVKACQQKASRYQIDAEFDKMVPDQFRRNLGRYIDQSVRRLQASEGAPKTILIADADTFTQNFYWKILKAQGHRVLLASDSTQLLTHLEKETIHLLIIDLLLPTMGGRNVVDLIMKRRMSFPVVVATAEANPRVIRKITPRIQECLFKPFPGARLLEIIQRILTERQSNVLTRGKTVLIPLHLEANVTVAFRDHVHLNQVSSKGISFVRKTPMAPGITLALKTDAVVREESSENEFLDLKVVRCQHQEQGGFLIVAAFIQQSGTG